jgi:muramoyltetrapeptide carboxypeptidase
MVRRHRLPVLRPGDLITVISPAGHPAESKLNQGIRAIEERGFKVGRGAHLSSQHRELAGDDDSRLGDLLQALRNYESNAVFCSRGGYGSSRLLSVLARRGIGNIPKLVVGFSDITALQWALRTLWQWPSISGPVVTELGGSISPDSEEAFWALVQGKSPRQLGFGKPAINVLRHGEAQGELMPGCLSIICSLIGTPYIPDLSGAILVVEDIGEEPFRIDRMLVHLKNAGILEQIGALVLGQFLKEDAKTEAISQAELHQRINEILPDFQGPIVMNIPYGHDRDRWSLPVGVPVKLSTDPFVIEMI